MKKHKLSNQKNLFIFLMVLPAVVLPMIFTYYPLIAGGKMAFYNYNLFNINNIKFVGLDNFKNLFTTSAANDFYQIIWNTVIWVGVSLFFQFTIGFGLALILKKKFRGSGIYQGLIFFPWAVSGFLIGIMWRWMFNGTSGVINDMLMRAGIIETQIGWLSSQSTALLSCIIANVWYGIPFFTIMITAALRGVPADLYEAADMDGANKLQQFWHVTVPSIKSVLMLTLLLRVIWIFNFPDLIYSMTSGGPAGSSHIITSYMMEAVYALDYGKASAIGLFCIVLLSMFALFYLWVSKRNED